jgi:hypothetical protein
MNDAKNDLSLDQFLEACRLVLERHGLRRLSPVPAAAAPI